MKKMTPESIALQQIREVLQLAGWLVIRNQQSMGSHKGLSDLVALRSGRVVWIEVKAPAGTDRQGRKRRQGELSEHQQKFQADIESHGGEFVVARSVDDVTHLVGRNNQ